MNYPASISLTLPVPSAAFEGSAVFNVLPELNQTPARSSSFQVLSVHPAAAVAREPRATPPGTLGQLLPTPEEPRAALSDEDMKALRVGRKVLRGSKKGVKQKRADGETWLTEIREIEKACTPPRTSEKVHQSFLREYPGVEISQKTVERRLKRIREEEKSVSRMQVAH